MKRWIALGSGLLVLFASLASCNTFDPRGGDGFSVAPPPPDFGGTFPGFGPAGSPALGAGGAPFFGGGSGGFPPPAAGSGGGGWQLLDGGTPPPPSTDDSGADDAG